MAENNDKINELIARLELLLKRQDSFSLEIKQLRLEIEKLKIEIETGGELPKTIADRPKSIEPVVPKEVTPQPEVTIQKEPVRQMPVEPTPVMPQQPKEKSDLEKFIGENLISKIGIVITVIGVAIGAKYSIENNLISPLTRIILGYLAGLSLLGVGIRLKNKYENYSAVLVSGSMAIMYFITYAAYSFYHLFPQLVAFLLMIVFTVFTVIAAITYNREVIAQIGLVGAYAVPFLLSEGSGKVGVLFSYMSIINVGILFISFKKNWRSICYSAFGFTWIIYLSWYFINYRSSEHFTLALCFLSIFFVIFYLTFLANKIVRDEQLKTGDVILILLNSIIFFGVGYSLFDDHDSTRELLGLFTLGNGIIHFMVSIFIYKRKLGDHNLLYLVAGMVLVFITIAIPVQLDGNWVTLLWAGEAVLLFWIGRNKGIPIYEKLSYPLILLTLLSIVHDWTSAYNPYSIYQLKIRLTPLFNSTFLTSVLIIAAFLFIVLYSRKQKYVGAYASNKEMESLISVSTASVLLVTIYCAFYLEISNYWNQLYADSEVILKLQYLKYLRNYDLLSYKSVWVINYSIVFFSLLAVVNYRFIKNRLLAISNLSLMAVSIVVFLTQGLYVLSELRESYLNRGENLYFQISAFNIGIRYISLAIVFLAVIVCYRYAKQEFLKPVFKITFDVCLHIICLWIATSELIHWMDIIGAKESYKLGFSILWGIYSLFLVILGIWKNKKYLRIFAIALFGITLVKLFFYDIAHLNTIAKTIVFVSLGVLLLIISFLYNKYKNIIFDEPNH
jgi:uncharacterized membrane protein